MSPRVSTNYKAEKRNEILAAAKRVFRLKGYDLTSMEDIIEEAKMSKGGVYHYFSGKEDIFESILKERAESFSSFPFQDGVPVWNTIQQVLSEIAVELTQTRESFAPVLFEYFMRSYRDPSREQALMNQYNQGVLIWTAAIEKGVSLQEFKPKLPAETIAKTIVSFIDGLYCDALQLGHTALDIDGQKQAILFYLAHALDVQTIAPE
ncbi:UNVERIFIED_CONTAM: AcrR family transcriptional regulator [Brevibacillus sp. OAP136]